MANPPIKDPFDGPQWIPDHASDAYFNRITGEKVSGLQAEMARRKLQIEAENRRALEEAKRLYAGVTYKSYGPSPPPPRPIGAPLPPPGLMGSPLAGGGGFSRAMVFGKPVGDLTDEELITFLKSNTPADVEKRLAQLVKDWTNTIKNLHNENVELKKEVKTLKYELNGPEDDGKLMITNPSFHEYITKAIKATEKRMAEALTDDDLYSNKSKREFP